MASPTLPVLDSADFHNNLNQAMTRMIARIDDVLAASYLSSCDFEDEYCDCRARATVHHRESEKEYCLRHFHMVVGRG